jgi:hypothetical protein
MEKVCVKINVKKVIVLQKAICFIIEKTKTHAWLVRKTFKNISIVV